jgi:PPOX class probable F420-dependent enzyme
VSRRAAIAMDRDELARFLEEERTLTIATLGRDGWPHLMPLWYVLRCEERSGDEGEAVGTIWAWTYAKSQKVRNLERDPRCTLQVEAGLRYDQLRGAMIKAECEIHRDPEVVAGLAAELARRYAVGDVTPDVEAAWRSQVPKRVALRFLARETATWNHRKLG